MYQCPLPYQFSYPFRIKQYHLLGCSRSLGETLVPKEEKMELPSPLAGHAETGYLQIESLLTMMQ